MPDSATMQRLTIWYLFVSGYIPAPLLFGKIIDSSCLIWKEKCGSQGACLLYNIVHFRFKYIGKYMQSIFKRCV